VSSIVAALLAATRALACVARLLVPNQRSYLVTL
jgi:hypothetical protein